MKNFIIECSIGLLFGLISILILKELLDSEFLIGWISAIIAVRSMDYFSKIIK